MSNKIIDPVEHFWSKVLFIPFYDCLEWNAAKNNHGYGSFYDGNNTFTAHKWMYERNFGKIPLGFDLDHKCRNRGCVNLNHLELVTHKENVLRGIGPTAINAKKTHCKNGHELIERKCKICDSEYQKKYAEKHREKKLLYYKLRYQRQKDITK